MLWRMLYTLVFFIVVSTILMNIIFGVIIDTFAGEKSQLSGRNFISGFFLTPSFYRFYHVYLLPPPGIAPNQSLNLDGIFLTLQSCERRKTPSRKKFKIGASSAASTGFASTRAQVRTLTTSKKMQRLVYIFYKFESYSKREPKYDGHDLSPPPPYLTALTR